MTKTTLTPTTTMMSRCDTARWATSLVMRRRRNQTALFAELHLTHAEEPASYAEAKNDPA